MTDSDTESTNNTGTDTPNDAPDDTVNVVATDLEGTLTEGSTWRGMRGYLLVHGRRGAYYRFFARHLPSLLLTYLGWREERVFKDAFISGLMTLFAGFSRAEFGRVAAYVVDTELWPQRHIRVVAELQAQQALGNTVVVASGVFQPIAEHFAARLGAEALGTPIEMRGDTLSGRLAGPINVGEVKGRRLQAWLEPRPLLRAYGDTIDDLAMLEQSLEPVVVAPDNNLGELAAVRGWRVISAGQLDADRQLAKDG
ncbi:MAG: haloacid dehalogenase-like hydrolase [Trueperaceae bacterium]|nr:haloacid dehalogenase-like hydrolase [Trueperaceae bacterium]